MYICLCIAPDRIRLAAGFPQERCVPGCIAAAVCHQHAEVWRCIDRLVSCRGKESLEGRLFYAHLSCIDKLGLGKMRGLWNCKR